MALSVYAYAFGALSATLTAFAWGLYGPEAAVATAALTFGLFLIVSAVIM